MSDEDNNQGEELVSLIRPHAFPVKQATWTQPDGKKREVAVKCIQKKLVKSKPSVVQDETDVLQGLSHPHVIKILDFFEASPLSLVSLRSKADAAQTLVQRQILPDL